MDFWQNFLNFLVRHLSVQQKMVILNDNSKNENDLKNEDHVKDKNAGHEMAIVGEPCNVDAHAKIPALYS